ncbi:MAG: hypothetical protein BWY38_02681 [Ignavibacteria bacterium ADurb.Bin266]|nr:MAG: hypothetical protein BWY38_02681 [Ignavibacteria bacterium ADurb.Bin266]
MEFEEWFNGLRKENFPDLWDEYFKSIDCYYYSDEYDGQIILRENGDKYISFLENQIEFMFNELMKNKNNSLNENYYFKCTNCNEITTEFICKNCNHNNSEEVINEIFKKIKLPIVSGYSGQIIISDTTSKKQYIHKIEEWK